jgi:peptidoglycan/LPS O-acetylase OafA/YrhL
MKAGIGKEVIGKIALWSYSAYLWNNTIFRYFTLHPVPGPWILGVLVFLFCTFFVSWITYSWIELPGIHLRKRWMSS